MDVGETRHMEIATGGDPENALLHAVLPYTPAGEAQVMELAVAHDDECPCAGNERPMGDCTCEIVEVRLVRHA
jgi:hypothetical protein